MRNKLLYIAVPLFTFLAFYRFWNQGPITSPAAKERGVHTSAYVYPAAMTSADHFISEKKSEATQR